MPTQPIYQQSVEPTAPSSGPYVPTPNTQVWDALSSKFAAQAQDVVNKEGEGVGARMQQASEDGKPISDNIMLKIASAFTPTAKSIQQGGDQVYVGQQDQQLQSGLAKIQAEHPNDPQGYTDAATAYARDLFKDAPLHLASPLNQMADQTILRTSGALQQQKIATDFQTQVASGLDAIDKERANITQATTPEEHDRAVANIAQIIDGFHKMGVNPNLIRQVTENVDTNVLTAELTKTFMQTGDKAGMIKALRDGTLQVPQTRASIAFTPEMRERLATNWQGQLNQMNHDADRAMARAALELGSKIDDNVAQIIRDGKDMLSEDQIKQLPPRMQQRARETAEVAHLQFDLTQGNLSGMPTDQVKQYLDANVRPPEGDPNFARKEHLYEGALNVLAARDQKIAAGGAMDVVYAGDRNGLLAFQSQNPGDVQAAIVAGQERASRISPQAGQVAASNPLPESQAKALAAQLETAPDPNAIIDQVKTKYGQFAPAVISQAQRVGKVSPGLTIAMSLPSSTPGEQQDRNDFVLAQQMKEADLKKMGGLDDPALTTNLKTTMNSTLDAKSGMYGTLIAQGAFDAANAYRDSVEKYSTLLISKGMSASDAVRKANQVASGAYDIDPEGKYRVPRGFLNNAQTVIGQATTSLTPQNLYIKHDPNSEISLEQAQRDERTRVQYTSYWINDPNGTGNLRMVYQPMPGVVRPVTVFDANGHPTAYEIPGADIKSGKFSRPAGIVNVGGPY